MESLDKQIVYSLVKNLSDYKSEEDKDIKLETIKLINKIVDKNRQNNVDYMIKEYKNINWNLQNEPTEETILRIEKLLPIVNKHQEDIIERLNFLESVNRSGYKELYERILCLERDLVQIKLNINSSNTFILKKKQ